MQEKEKRFRGTWTPIINDPKPMSYSSAATQAIALEKVVEIQAEPTLEPNRLSPEDIEETIPQLVAGIIGDELSSDADVAARRVAEFKSKHEGVDLDALCEMLIREKCKQSFVVGLCSAAPALVLPGWGNLASILMGTAVDVSLTTRLEVDLAMEIVCLYDRHSELATPEARKSFLLRVSGLEGLEKEDEQATTEAGSRLAIRTGEEVGKRSLLRYVPIVGGVTAAGTNVVGVYVIGRRAQLIATGKEHELGTWRDSVNRFAVPKEVSTVMAEQMSKVPSALTLKAAQVASSLGQSVRKLLSNNEQSVE